MKQPPRKLSFPNLNVSGILGGISVTWGFSRPAETGRNEICPEESLYYTHQKLNGTLPTVGPVGDFLDYRHTLHARRIEPHR